MSNKQKLTKILLLIYWPAAFIIAHTPIPKIVCQAQVSDKILHFLGYLILVFLLWFTVASDKKVNWRKATVWWVFPIMAGYGIIDELLQEYMGRSCDIMDFFADLTGTLTGLILFSFFTFWPAFLAVMAITIFLLTNLTRVSLSDLMPITNALFHLFAYGIFTALWITNIHSFLPAKIAKPKWLILALALPIALLAVVKLFSVIYGKDLLVNDLVLALSGIASVIATVFLIALFRRSLAQRRPCGNPERLV